MALTRNNIAEMRLKHLELLDANRRSTIQLSGILHSAVALVALGFLFLAYTKSSKVGFICCAAALAWGAVFGMWLAYRAALYKAAYLESLEQGFETIPDLKTVGDTLEIDVPFSNFIGGWLIPYAVAFIGWIFLFSGLSL